MGIKYLWDTNTVIYCLQQQFSPQAEQFIDDVLTESVPCISAITEIELLCWKKATVKDMDLMKKCIADSWIIELEQAGS